MPDAAPSFLGPAAPPAAPPAGAPPAGAPPATPPAGAPPAGTPPGTPPAGAPPAGTPPAYASPLAAGLNADGTYKEGWTQQLADMGLTRLANRLVTSTNEGDALRSLDHALGLIGKKHEVGPPKPGATAQDITAYREAVGIPADAKGYELDKVLSTGILEGQGQDISEFSDLLHAGHVPKEVAQQLAGKYADLITKQHEAAGAKLEEGLNTRFAEADAVFKKEWGDEHEGRLAANRDYVQTLGLDMNDPIIRAALSLPFVIRALDSSRRALRGNLPGADGKDVPLGGTHSARQQAQEIMKANPGWKSNPQLHAQVTQLYALDAAQSKRK